MFINIYINKLILYKFIIFTYRILKLIKYTTNPKINPGLALEKNTETKKEIKIKTYVKIIINTINIEIS